LEINPAFRAQTSAYECSNLIVMPEYFSFPDPCSTTGSRNCVFRSTPRWRRRCRTIIFSNCDCDMSSWHYDYQTRNCAQFYWRTSLKVKISESMKRLDLKKCMYLFCLMALFWFYLFYRINNFHDIYCSRFEPLFGQIL
jgi:hypothetical protein